MKKFTVLILISLFGLKIFSQDLEIIRSNQIEKSSDNYESSIKEYKTSEFWGMWTMKIGDAYATSNLKAQGQVDYSIENISDYDLNTAWIEGKSDYGIGERFGFIFNFPSNTGYGGAYQFYGKVNLFNGYCKSPIAWQQNSRVRTLKVYYNDLPLCVVELIDTWHFQSFDIGKFFKYERNKKYLDAPYEIKNGDRLTFEIIDVYVGTEHKDVAITEFMAEGAGN